MPIYEYQCDGCDEVFEVRQKMSDPPPRSHTCGDTRVRRVLSNTSFVLKGTGWYKTDYAQNKPNNSAGHERVSGKDTAKSASAPAAQGEAKGDKSSPKPPDGSGGGSPAGGKKGSSKGSQAA